MKEKIILDRGMEGSLKNKENLKILEKDQVRCGSAQLCYRKAEEI